jgi:hypothetical protein
MLGTFQTQPAEKDLKKFTGLADGPDYDRDCELLFYHLCEKIVELDQKRKKLFFEWNPTAPRDSYKY